MSGRAQPAALSQPDTPRRMAPHLTDAEVRALPAMATVAQTAAALGLGTRTFYTAIAHGELPAGLEPLRIRGAIRFRQSDILHVLKLDA